jgi:hypothetical protein
LHEIFLEISYLTPATPWKPEEVQRLRPALPPGFAEENGCWCLEETKGAIRIGLAQLPSAQALQALHHRLSGYPLYFEALTYADSQLMRTLC